MPTFTPPVGEGRPWLHPDARGAEKGLMKFFGTCPMGFTVWKDLSDVWHQEQYPLDTNFQVWIDNAQPNNAKVVYHGGHSYTITEAEANELIAAGYMFDWWELTNWTHSWDAKNSVVEGGRVTRIPDLRGNKPLIKMGGVLPLLGANINAVGPLPGPTYLASSPRFNNHAAVYTDSFPAPGSFFPLFAGLSPNVSTTSSINEPDNWFNAPSNGYPQPYWVAILARTTDGPATAVWDAQNGGIGTGPTIGPDIFGGVDHKWEVSLFGPDGGTNKVENPHVSSPNETTLVFCYVNGASSFLEVTWKDGAGVPSTLRQTGTLGPHRYLECFLGWVHDVYWMAAGIKLGTPLETELDFIRSWALAFMPAAAVLPPGV